MFVSYPASTQFSRAWIFAGLQKHCDIKFIILKSSTIFANKFSLFGDVTTIRKKKD